jgi:hypothetical protein
MTTNTKNKIKGVVLSSFLVAVIAAVIVMILVRTNATNPMSEPGVYVTGIELNVGKYYINGDTDSYYFEVFEDKTIQLGGIDPVEYYYSFEDTQKYLQRGYELCPDVVSQESQRDATRLNYDIVRAEPCGTMLVNTYIDEPVEGAYSGFAFINENNIRVSEKVFTFVAQ